jgi:FdhD protein
MTAAPHQAVQVRAEAYRHGRHSIMDRTVPDEVAIALSYDRVGYAVMMATPTDLVDFAIGFSLSEGIIDRASDVYDCELVTVEQGIECRLRVAHDVAARLAQRRRHMAGALGCGLCGLESLAEATRDIPPVTSAMRFSARGVMAAMRQMARLQRLNAQTHGVHAAAFYQPDRDELLVREDVGRHNALDKIIGALARDGRSGAAGAVLLTSRVSIELIQKCGLFGAPLIVAVSVPTAHAIRTANDAGITLAAVARDDGFEIFTHPQRIEMEEIAHVA